MKKLSYIFILSTLFLFSYYLYFQKHDYCKIFKIVNPTTIYLDKNKNLIFDETTPFIINNICFIDVNKIYTDDDFFSKFSQEQKLFLSYKQNYIINKLLHNTFVKIKNNEIYIKNKSLKQLLLGTGYFCENSQKSKELLFNNISSINISDYVFFNNKSKKYHKLDCQLLENIFSYKLVNITKLDKNATPCKNCFTNIKKITNKFENKNNNKIKKVKNSSNIYNSEYIKVYYQNLNNIFEPTNKCNSAACKTLKNEIDNAKKTIDFSIYGINNQNEIFNALTNAQKRGVKIRWVTDFDKKEINHYNDTLKLMKKLNNYNTDEFYDLSNRPAIMHNKFFIFDNKKVFTGSSNISSTDITEFNSNISVLINNQSIAQIFTNEFNQMYNGFFHTDKKQTTINKTIIDKNTKVSCYFSPQDKITNSQIIPLIKSAKKYIYIPIFFLTKKELIYPLKEAYDKKIDIKIIIDANSSNSQYSIHNELRKHGIQVKVENYAGKMHSKAIIIDDKISIVGSMNFSNNGDKRNDENVLIIENEEITQFLKEKFLNIWNKIPNKYLYKNIKAESLESIGSCNDNIDNDYDGKIDKFDEYCNY